VDSGTGAVPVPVVAVPPVDEIAERQDTRIVGAHSALMALRGVPEVALTPPCESLDLHLENDQTIYGDLATGAGRAAALRRVSKSRLEGFFRGNSDPGLVTRGRHASHVPYELWPSYFIWSQEKGVWSPRRQRGRAKVGRIRWAHPSDGDIFYLRRLLMSPHGIGAPSFAALRTVGTTVQALDTPPITRMLFLTTTARCPLRPSLRSGNFGCLVTHFLRIFSHASVKLWHPSHQCSCL
jgi:hypothetical protein